MRNKRGITLVSLVVTIIVLIILAGVSINLTIGENGIITMAKKARENMELATIEEETKLNALYTQIELEDENIGGIDNNSISKLIEFKQKVASAITDMGIETLETANADTMASNIRKISRDAASISYDNINSTLNSNNLQGVVDEISNELMKSYDYTIINIDTNYLENASSFLPMINRDGNLVSLRGRCRTLVELSAKTWYQIGTIPLGYRPKLDYSNILFGMTLNGVVVEGTYDNSGTIQIRPTNGNISINDVIYLCTITYIAEDTTP